MGESNCINYLSLNEVLLSVCLTTTHGVFHCLRARDLDVPEKNTRFSGTRVICAAGSCWSVLARHCRRWESERIRKERKRGEKGERARRWRKRRRLANAANVWKQITRRRLFVVLREHVRGRKRKKGGKGERKEGEGERTLAHFLPLSLRYADPRLHRCIRKS